MKLKQFIKNHNKSFSNIFDGMVFNYLNDFQADDRERVKSIIKEKYSDLIVDYDITTWEEFQEAVKSALFDHSWNINKMAELFNANFNPLENYNKTETITDVYGSKTTTTDIGAQTGSATSGSQTNTNTDSIFPYDDSQSTDTTKNTNEIGARTDTSSTSARQDVVGEASHTDTHTNITTGNIGVMSSQDMWNQQWRLIKHNYHEQIAYYIVCDVCIPLFM